jgi:hypothetical protein
MKITKTQLKKIIKEVLEESEESIGQRQQQNLSMYAKADSRERQIVTGIEQKLLALAATERVESDPAVVRAIKMLVDAIEQALKTAKK